jgi:hypothetical protein
MDNGLHQITHRELISGVLTAVIALAEKLTGERLTVYVHTEAGGDVAICGGPVQWSKDLQAAEVRHGHPEERPATRS